MSKELVINQTHSECRIALKDNGEILDFLVERGSPDENYPTVGNIYLGKVSRVLPGMQSAFIDIGTDRAAFLYVDDAYIPTLDEQREMTRRLEESGLEAQKRVGEVIPDELSSLSESVDMKFRPDVKIQDFLKEGDEIVVQVAKEPISTKGPRVTRHISLAGRHIVYMPFIEHTGVSRRIESEEERTRLKDVLDSIRPEGVGVIARTVAEGQSYKVLKNDYNNLVRIWRDIQKRTDKSKAPSDLHQDLSFIQRALRDITDEEVESIIVDSKSSQKAVEKYIKSYLPNHKAKVKFHQKDTPIFEEYQIEAEISKALSNKVYLKSGGSLNIDQTEALVSVDVNTGKFVGKKNLEETIYKNNLEAVKEIAYQLRLRNCGGIIIIDFIDMEKEEHRDEVYRSLLEELKKDRAKTNVLPISGLGLVEMTRKRTRDTLIRMMCTPCPYCEGVGRVKSVETVCFDIIREAGKTLKKTASHKVTIFAHPEVCAKLSSEELNIIEAYEESFQKSLIVRADNSYHIEQYDIYTHET